MPLLDISKVPQRWLVCVLCSWAFCLHGLKFSSFLQITNIVESLQDNKLNNSNKVSSEQKAPKLTLPDFYLNLNITKYTKMAFQIGRLLSLLPAGVVSDIGFSKHVLCGGITLIAVDNLCLLASKYVSAEIYVLSQMLNGIGQACLWTSIYSLISRWAPPSKLYIFNVLTFSGYAFGFIITNAMFFKYVYLKNNSWTDGNIITGALVLLWLPFGFIFIYHSPNESPFMNQQEHPINTNRERRFSAPLLLLIRLRKIPWFKIFLSCQLLSLALAYCSMVWSYFKIPTKKYGVEVLHIPQKTIYTVTDVSHIAASTAALMGAWLADWVVYHKILSKTVLMKILVFISAVIPTVLRATILLTKYNDIRFWMLYCASDYILGFAACNIQCGAVNLSPENSGVLMGVMIGVKSIIHISDNFIQDHLYNITKILNTDLLRFRVIYYSILTLAMAVPYLFFGSEEPQNWKRQFSVTRPRRTMRRTVSNPI